MNINATKVEEKIHRVCAQMASPSRLRQQFVLEALAKEAEADEADEASIIKEAKTWIESESQARVT